MMVLPVETPARPRRGGCRSVPGRGAGLPGSRENRRPACRRWAGRVVEACRQLPSCWRLSFVNVVERLSPEQFWARLDEFDEQMRAAAHLLPLYGVADWTGPVMTGDWEWHNDRLELAELAHGDPLGEGLCIAVATSTDARAPAGLPGHEHIDAAASTVGISVGGQPVELTCWRDAHAWSATGRLADHHLRIQARGITPEQVTLIRITDIEPYLAGRRSYLRAARGGI